MPRLKELYVREREKRATIARLLSRQSYHNLQTLPFLALRASHTWNLGPLLLGSYPPPAKMTREMTDPIANKCCVLLSRH